MIGLFLVGCIAAGSLDVAELEDTGDQVAELEDTGDQVAELDSGDGLEDTGAELEAGASAVLGLAVECDGDAVAVAWELDGVPAGVVQVELWPTLAGAGVELGDAVACGSVPFPGVTCDAGPFVVVLRAPGAPCLEVGGRHVSTCEHRATMPAPVCPL